MTSLEQTAAEAIQDGWAVLRTDIRTLLLEATGLGWRPVPIRRGEPALSTLRVVDAEDAHVQSLSAMVGRDRQPLHTDGAHHRVMPDIVLLAAVAPSPTPTLLRALGVPTESQRAGVFKVGGGRDAFYSSAIDTAGRWRYDPGCMTPMDDDARHAAAEFAALTESAFAHYWTEPGNVLVIANRRALHARAAASDASTRRVHRAALISGLDG
ncbi:TauD/TfdA family dioxygenase [Microbacterium sp. ISL-59]|nr:TauD/TfdA family dioxygenase [Microbacterium sp. ISL-59]